MSTLPIYTSETMVTRALAAEIRHDATSFIQLLEERAGVGSLGELESVRCEGRARVDLELTFRDRADYSLGIEAKVDHELTPEQVDAELATHDHLVLVLPSVEATPRWLVGKARTTVMTWPELLGCFSDSRITGDDLASMPLSKLAVEIILGNINLHEKFPDDWTVLLQRGGGGIPALYVESPALPSGRILRGQLQVCGRRVPPKREDVRVEYCIGVPVDDSDTDLPDPTLDHDEPDWITSLRTLRQHVLLGHEPRLGVSLHAAGKPGTERGQRKLPLADLHLDGERWLVKGYIPSYLGIRSRPFTLDQLPELAEMTVEIFTSWYRQELKLANV